MNYPILIALCAHSTIIIDNSINQLRALPGKARKNMEKEELLFLAWEYGTSPSVMTEDARKEGDVLLRYLGADRKSPMGMMVQGFILGLHSGIELYQKIEEIGKQ